MFFFLSERKQIPMKRHRCWWVLFSVILSLAGTPGCSVTKPSLNSFQASMKQEKKSAHRDTLLMDGRKVVILIHGIYGDTDTFGRLADLLIEDQAVKADAVYVMEYWSSRFFPNFQRLADLGAEFAEHLEKIASDEASAQVVVIAHSQGGLIARNAILAMQDKGKTAILDRMKLIMIGTPNYASLYATYNNLIVNSVYSVPTYVLGLVTFQLVPPLVYNRQAYDMANMRLDLIGGRDQPSPFMENMILRWAKAFPAGANRSPKVYAVLGVKNLLGHYDLSDGVVHSVSSLFVGVPAQRIHYVPYRHFGDEAAIEDDSHRTYRAIKAILIEGDNPVPYEQSLSPFRDFAFSKVMFVQEAMEQLIRVDEVTLLPKDLNGKHTKIKADPGGALLRLLGELVLFPFQLLQSFAQVPVSLWDAKHDAPPTWKRLTSPEEILDGDYDGLIQVSRSTESKRGVFSLTSGREKKTVSFTLTDSDEEGRTHCRTEHPIDWNTVGKEDTFPIEPLKIQKLKIAPNSVNFIKVETEQDKITLSTGNCIASN